MRKSDFDNNLDYYYKADNPHAVTGYGAQSDLFEYDANGQMIKRYTKDITYDAQGNLISYDGDTHVYDGDGNRVATVLPDGNTRIFIGNYYETIWVSDNDFGPVDPPALTSGQVYNTYLPVIQKKEATEFETIPGQNYYYAGSSRIATSTAGGKTRWIYGDHLGSTSVTADKNGEELSRSSYYAWGTTRSSTGVQGTDYGYTGQIQVGDIYYYNARWYDPMIGRFMQADTIVPTQQGTQGFDRYAYINNNPVNGTDPTGHCYVDPRDPYVDYECHSLALQISEAESQGSPHLTDILYEEFDMYSYESLQEYYNVGVAPYLKVQQFTAKMAESVAISQIDDVDALVSILEYSYAIAGGDLEFGLVYASSAFYRSEIGLLGGGKDYQYIYITNASFGISGFHDNYTGVSTNTNQLEHFIGEAAIFSHLGLNQRLGNLGAWYQDPGNSAESIADRKLGQLASWWVNQGFFKVSISGLGKILRRGELQYAQ